MHYPPERFAEFEASAEARQKLGQDIRVTNLGEFECPGFQLGYFYSDSPVIGGGQHPVGVLGEVTVTGVLSRLRTLSR